jgi:Domain of unknown function (DUF4349)
MKLVRKDSLDAKARVELEAIDAALNGSPAAPEHAQLAAFARDLRQARPVPREAFAQNLDARALEGFRPSTAQDRQSGRPRRRVSGSARARHNPPFARPAVGVALAAVLAAAIAVPLALSGSRHVGATPIAGAVRSAPAASAPAQTASGPAKRGDLAEPQAPAFAARGSASSAVPSGAAAPARAVERTATLDVGVAPSSIQSASQQVFTRVSSFGGYVRESSVSSGGFEQGGASFDLRIPSANLSVAMAALSHLGHVRSENDTTNDVTEQLNSLDGSLGDARAERASVLKQLRAASEAGQEAALRARLQYLEGRISQLERELASLRTRVNYTAVALTLTAEAPVAAKQGDLTPGGAAHDAGQILEAALAVAVLGAAAVVPAAAVALAAWALIGGSRRRLREQALDAS